MKHLRNNIFIFACINAFLFVVSSCIKEEITEKLDSKGVFSPVTTPTLTTVNVSAITTESAISGGNITSHGGAQVTSRGVCWSLTPTPTISHNLSVNGNGIGTYTSNISGLTANKTYYLRAYATNSMGTAYGNEVIFKTLQGVPVVVTASISSITSNSAVSGGNVTSDGGGAITARGLVWSTSQNPTLANHFTTNGTGLGEFISNMTSLLPGTIYYVRAYATNSMGTAYGSERSFLTYGIITLSQVTTTEVLAITQNSASSGGNVTSSGGGSVTARGIVWSTSQNPTLANNYTNNGTGLGIFSSNLAGLLANTTYYLRAYATNSAGTAYGSQSSFTTLLAEGSKSTVTDADGNTYVTVYINGKWWMAENLKTTKYNDGTNIPLITDNTSWYNSTSPAYCWYNNSFGSYGNVYGALYNWYTVNTGKLCPSGWSVPTDAQWTTLSEYLGGSSVSGGKLKVTGTSYWSAPNTGATNSYGLNGLPGGTRGSTDGWFGSIRDYGFWWSSTQYSTDARYAWYYRLYFNDASFSRTTRFKAQGYSVRCVKN